MALTDWDLHVAARCGFVAEADPPYLCMACLDAPAVGHVQARGGIHNGRVLALLCSLCARPKAMEKVKQALVDQALAGFLDVATGGPGPQGSPIVQHDDHEHRLEDLKDTH